jgi:protein-disulfide isomerase
MDREQLTEGALLAIAGQLKLDPTKFKADMNGPGCKAALDKDQRALRAVGVSGTPAIHINGRPYVGQRTLDGFSAVIDAELKKAEASQARGAAYYDSLMKNAKKTI